MFCKDARPGDQLAYCIQNDCYVTRIGKSTIKDNGIFCTRFARNVKKIVLATLMEDKKPKEFEPGIHEIVGKEYIACSNCYMFNAFNSGKYEVYMFNWYKPRSRR
jgi:hypothetical protein